MTATTSFWAALPQAPGVYQMVDRRGRVIYVGRSGNLRSRVRSYWSAEDPYRPDLKRMAALVARVDHIECISEHDAAFLERDLIARLEPRFNRTYGVEAQWWLRLEVDPERPNLEPVREPDPAATERCFGPYLGGRSVRLAAAALRRLYPLHLCAAAPDANERDLARTRGVGPADLLGFAGRIAAVLDRDPEAVSACLEALTAQRDRAAAGELFERAGELQDTIRAVEWLTQPRAA